MRNPAELRDSERPPELAHWPRSGFRRIVPTSVHTAATSLAHRSCGNDDHRELQRVWLRARNASSTRKIRASMVILRHSRSQ
jgi:hypothetical protein